MLSKMGLDGLPELRSFRFTSNSKMEIKEKAEISYRDGKTEIGYVMGFFKLHPTNGVEKEGCLVAYLVLEENLHVEEGVAPCVVFANSNNITYRTLKTYEPKREFSLKLTQG